MNLLCSSRLGLAAAMFGVALSATATAQIGTPPTLTLPYVHDTGFVRNDGAVRDVIISFTVRQPRADWMRLYFDQISLGGDLPSGNQAILRITSHADGAIQELNATHVRQWENSSAYFNGDAIQVEVVAYPGTGARLVTRALDLSMSLEDPGTICGPNDNRELSSDPRAARLLPIGCSGWMIDDCGHCLLTAGHCQGNISVVQFNVPLSDNNGSINHPPPSDQYSKDNSSLQGNGGQGVGNDWAYFGTFPNTNTGLTAFEAQGSSYILMNPPPVGKAKIRITGYGVDSGNRNQVQQTEWGPLVNSAGSTLGYRTDTTGGNSGSPVIWKQTDFAVGIHTHGGCTNGGGNNWGTGINHSGLQNALANPQGVCSGGAVAQTIFADGFESGDFAAGGWTTQDAKAKVTAFAANAGSFGARLKKDTWMEKAISTVGFTEIELNLSYKSKNYEGADELVIEYWNGATWITLHSDNSGPWYNRNFGLGSDAENNANLRLRMRTNALEAKERSDIDNVELTGK
jgi:hypothetical protein